MDRQMEPTSQMFSQGGILSRDWFSDKLQNKEEVGGWNVPAERAKAYDITDRDCSEPHFNKVTANLALPITYWPNSIKFLQWQS